MTQMTMTSSAVSADAVAVQYLDPARQNRPQAPLTEAPVPDDDAAAEQTNLADSDRSAIVSQLNKALEAFETHVSISVDEKSKERVVKVIDDQTGKVIRQIPSEHLLRISQRITELLGVIYDEKM